MSSKIQTKHCENNNFWVHIIKNKWKRISRITESIKSLKNQLLQEENKFLQLSKDTPEYIGQQKKIICLTSMIKHSEKTINHELYMIKSASSFLARSTC